DQLLRIERGPVDLALRAEIPAVPGDARPPATASGEAALGKRVEEGVGRCVGNESESDQDRRQGREQDPIVELLLAKKLVQDEDALDFRAKVLPAQVPVEPVEHSEPLF